MVNKMPHPMMEFDERPRRPHNKLDINYITPASGAPVLGITSQEGFDNMLAKMRLHDPKFGVSYVTLNHPYTHKARMKQMNAAINYLTSILPVRELREWSLADYTYSSVRAASCSWPEGMPAVLFACRAGDRDRYPVFEEILELKTRIHRKKRGMLEFMAGMDVIERLREEKRKLEIAVKTLEQDAEMIAALTWTKTILRRDEPRHVFTERNVNTAE